MSVLHDVRQDLREFLAMDERGELDEAQRRARIDATIRDLQDFEVQLANALSVLANAPPAHQGGVGGQSYGAYSTFSDKPDRFPAGSSGGYTTAADISVAARVADGGSGAFVPMAKDELDKLKNSQVG